jgi:hypothetical protein
MTAPMLGRPWAVHESVAGTPVEATRPVEPIVDIAAAITPRLSGSAADCKENSSPGLLEVLGDLAAGLTRPHGDRSTPRSDVSQSPGAAGRRRAYRQEVDRRECVEPAGRAPQARCDPDRHVHVLGEDAEFAEARAPLRIGGAWCNQDRTSDVMFNEALAKSGAVVAALDFRMPPVASCEASTTSCIQCRS